jgi:multiple sugar transport system substrate-binding protein
MTARGRTTTRLRARTAAAAVLATCGLLVVGLAASTAASAHRTAGTGTITLHFWSAYNVADKEASTMAKTVIPQFEKQNPGIKVVSDVYPYSQLLQKYIAASAAGSPPDLLRSDIAWVPELASQGLALKVSAQPWFSPIAKAALPGPLLTTKYKGASYALPLDTNTQALYWNKADFQAAGISGPPTTMGDLIADAIKLTNPAKGQYGLGIDGTDIWNVAPYIWSMGGSFTNGTYTKASGFMNSAGTEAAVTQILNWKNAGYIGSDILGGASAVSGEQGFPKGQYAMYIDGPWAVSTYAALSPVPNYGIALFPAGKAGSYSTVGGEDLVVSKGGKNQAAAQKFAQFLDSPFAQLAMAKVGQMSALETTATAEVKATPYFKIFTEQLKTAKVRAVSQNYGKMDTIFSTALQEILAGKTSVSDGLNSAASQSDAALAGN